MFEYQIFVDGPVAFHTAWEADKAYSYSLALHLYEKFGSKNVTVFRRSVTVTKALGIDQIEDLFA